MPGPAGSPRPWPVSPRSSTPPASTSPRSFPSTAPCATRSPTWSRWASPSWSSLGGRHEEARVFRASGPATGPQVYFIEHLEYFNRHGIYGENGADYPDNHRRFAFFAMAACMALPRLVKGPALVHAHDWHTSLVPVYLRTTLAHEPYARTRHQRALGAQSGLSGSLRPRGDARHRAALVALQLAAARVVRQGQLPQGRPDLRRHGDDGEPHPGDGAAHARWRVRPAASLPRARRPPGRGAERHRPAGLEPDDRHPDHRPVLRRQARRQAEVQGGPPALVRAAAAPAGAALRDDRAVW